MEVAILSNIGTDDLVMQINSYLSTGWRLEGELIATYIEKSVDGVHKVLFNQKMVRGEYNQP